MDYLTKIANDFYDTIRTGLNYLIGNPQPVYAGIDGRNYSSITLDGDFNGLEWNVCFSKRQKGGKHQDKRKGHGPKKKDSSTSKKK